MTEQSSYVPLEMMSAHHIHVGQLNRPFCTFPGAPSMNHVRCEKHDDRDWYQRQYYGLKRLLMGEVNEPPAERD
ncbi:MAG: hypothetical protein IVW54_21220 [Candidatus Binataceae bacterium]|nr:hypothetical protein [Candidatus Binataceae bacterium]